MATLEAALVRATRAVEDAHACAHFDLLEWGRWSLVKRDGRPILKGSAVWTMPGDHDPGTDPKAEAAIPRLSFDEKRCTELDQLVNDVSFPSLWRRVVTMNYLPASKVRGIPSEFLRPALAGVSAASYVEQLAFALQFLQKPLDGVVKSA